MHSLIIKSIIFATLTVFVGFAVWIGSIQNDISSAERSKSQAVELQIHNQLILSVINQKTLDLAIEFGFDPLIVQTIQHYSKLVYHQRCQKCLTWRFVKDDGDLTYILLSIIKVESGGNTHTIGDGGRSFGLGQIQLATAKHYEPAIKSTELLTIEPQIRIAVVHFVELLTHYNGNITLAVLAWNRGEGGVQTRIAELGNPNNDGYVVRVFNASARRNAQ